MVPEREKLKPMRLRPMAGLFVCIGSIVTMFARGGSWRTASYLVTAVAALAILGFRIYSRRVLRAREPDPESTLKI
jgi:hypothetical protein